MATMYFIVTSDHSAILADHGFIPMLDLKEQMSHIMGFTTTNRAMTILKRAPRDWPGCNPVTDGTLQRTLFNRYLDVFFNPAEQLQLLKQNCIRDLSVDKFYLSYSKQTLPAAPESDNVSEDVSEDKDFLVVPEGNHVIRFCQNECAQAVLEALDAIANALNVMQIVNQKAYDQIEKLDNAVMDELHYAEMYALSAPKGYLVYKRFRELRRQRRILKDQVECIDLASEIFETITLEKIQAVKQTLQAKNRRQYRLREPDLFGHSLEGNPKFMKGK